MLVTRGHWTSPSSGHSTCPLRSLSHRIEGTQSRTICCDGHSRLCCCRRLIEGGHGAGGVIWSVWECQSGDLDLLAGMSSRMVRDSMRVAACKSILSMTDRNQVPQLILNYKSGSADGISLAFLTVWLIGDITNLIGTYLQRLLQLDCRHCYTRLCTKVFSNVTRKSEWH